MRLHRYIDLSQSSDLPTFERRMVECAQELGFGLVNATVVFDRPGKDPAFLAAGNTPQAFREASKNVDDSKRDPVLRRLKGTSLPFTYDCSLYVGAGAADLWEQQADFGYRTGIAVAAHLPRQQHFLFGLDRPEALPEDPEDLAEMLGSFQLLAVHAQEAALRLIAGPGEPRLAYNLTARELDVLRWTMDGKSAWAVGKILSISENTVNFHFRNVFRKLESSSKLQAVLKALGLGLL